MNESSFILFGLPVLLSLDLLTMAARAGLLNASYARLVSQQDPQEAASDQALALIQEMPRLRTSLNFSLALLRTLLIGLAFLLILGGEPAPHPATTLGVLLLGGLLVWFCEYLVEWQVLRDPEAWARRLASFASLLMTLLTPLLFLPVSLLQTDDEGAERAGSMTEDELMTLVDVGQREGVLEQDEREMIISIFRFGDTLAREIMVPRIDVQALDVRTPLPEAVDALLESGYSRVPVFDDTIDNVLGLLYVKDLLRAWRDGNHDAPLRDLLRPAYFVPEAKKADELLEEMQVQRVHIAIVVDEYGGMAGLVTLEDVVEEIIGEVRDEYDQAEELLFHQVGLDEYIFHGRIDLDDFNAMMGSQLPDDEADTLGGYLYSQIGRVPKGGETLNVDDILLTIEQVTSRRIRKVRARRLSLQPETDGEESTSTDEAHATGAS